MVSSRFCLKKVSPITFITSSSTRRPLAIWPDVSFSASALCLRVIYLVIIHLAIKTSSRTAAPFCIAWVSLPCLRSILGCNLKGNITKCPLPIEFVENGGSEKILFVCWFIVPLEHFHKATRAFSIHQNMFLGAPTLQTHYSGDFCLSGACFQVQVHCHHQF